MESIKAALTIDRDYLRIKRATDTICHVLSDCIPDACRREAYDRLANMLLKSDVAIVYKSELKELETFRDMTSLLGMNPSKDIG